MAEDDNLVETLPTKELFVDVLTRDISLDDAVLDLVDNCIDGAKRLHPEKKLPSRSDGSKSNAMQTHLKLAIIAAAFRLIWRATMLSVLAETRRWRRPRIRSDSLELE